MADNGLAIYDLFWDQPGNRPPVPGDQHFLAPGNPFQQFRESAMLPRTLPPPSS
jgi:hypothetical protein